MVGIMDTNSDDFGELTTSLLALRDALLHTVDVINTLTPSTKRRGVTLIETGANKISVIKVIREYTNWGLKESKDAAESYPTTFYITNAEDMLSKLNEVGAKAALCNGLCDDCKVRFQCYTN